MGSGVAGGSRGGGIARTSVLLHSSSLCGSERRRKKRKLGSGNSSFEKLHTYMKQLNQKTGENLTVLEEQQVRQLCPLDPGPKSTSRTEGCLPKPCQAFAEIRDSAGPRIHQQKNLRMHIQPQAVLSGHNQLVLLTHCLKLP